MKKYIYTTIAFLILPIQTLAEKIEDHDLNPIGDTSGGAPAIFSRLIKGLLGVIGVVALLFFIIGGFILLTSRGNTDKVKSGKDTIVWAIIGLFIAFFSYIILRFVLEIIVTPV